MRKLTSLLPNVVMLFLIISSSSCASQALHLPPILEARTLRLSTEVPGFEYRWQECTKKGIFGQCKNWEPRVEYYDLRDTETRDKLIHMGFVARVRDKILP